jgi:hypothetical protein
MRRKKSELISYTKGKYVQNNSTEEKMKPCQEFPPNKATSKVAIENRPHQSGLNEMDDRLFKQVTISRPLRGLTVQFDLDEAPRPSYPRL